jgi:hypothetical protein
MAQLKTRRIPNLCSFFILLHRFLAIRMEKIKALVIQVF